MKPRARLMLAAGLLLLPAFAPAAPIDRQLQVTITFDGAQDWKNALQWSKARTAQRYEISTTLRSDGKLYGANLLDLDTARRLAIKTEVLRQRGLEQLRAKGLDPKSPTLMADLSRAAQKDTNACKGEGVCMSTVGQKFAELMAAATEPDNSAVMAGEPRYQFFSAAPGCVNRIRSVLRSDTSGQTAYGREKDKLSPYALKMDGDFTGTATDQASLCTYYTAVVDTKAQRLYLENLYIPAAVGKIQRTEFGKTTEREGELFVAEPLQAWATATLRETTLSGSSSATLPLTMPLDGNSTLLGAFTGQGKATLEWSWAEPKK